MSEPKYRPHTDGTQIYVLPDYETREDAARLVLERVWACELRRYAFLAPIDWYCVRHGQVIGHVEIKCRNVPFAKYKTVFLAFRKWLGLKLSAVGSGRGSVFVASFTDGLFWIPIEQVDANRLVMGGRRDRGRQNDWEPMIEVPISEMVRVHEYHNEG